MVQVGRFKIVSVVNGTFRLDGGAMFGVVPKALWAKQAEPDEENRIPLAMRTLIAVDEPLAKVDGGLNAVKVEGDLVGSVIFEGPGAGARPTAGAVLADVLDIARDLVAGRAPADGIAQTPAVVRAAADHESRYYIRMTGANRPGVLAQVAGTLGDHGINIASVIQFGLDEDAPTEEFVITTYMAKVGRLREALDQIGALDGIVIGNLLPMAT